MKRFIDLRHTDVGRFAWYDTIADLFEVHRGAATWECWEEFATDFEGGDLERYRKLVPAWAFTRPDD